MGSDRFQIYLAVTSQGFPGGSEVKASARNAGDLGLIPGSGRSPGEGNGNPLQYSCLENSMNRGAWWATVHRVAKSRTRLSDLTDFPRCLNGKNPPANVGDSSTLGSGRSPGEGNCNLFQYSCLKIPLDRGTWWTIVHAVAESQTQLNASTATSSIRSSSNDDN